MLDRRRKGLIVLALLVAALAARHPNADFRLVTHDVGDPQPHRVQAAVDLGLIGVSFLYTWSRRLG